MEEFKRKIKRPGSVRLSDAQYEEMESLGMDNESAYVKYKLNSAVQHLKVIKEDSLPELSKTTPLNSVAANGIEERLALQRLEFENRQLQEKLDALHQSKEHTLNGVQHQVGNLLKEELQRRDFEQLKKDHAALQKSLATTEDTLKKSEAKVNEKEAEITALIKKLGLIELGKALLPGAISGLAQRFPSQMQGVANTLGAIGMGAAENEPMQNLEGEQQHLLQIATYFRELFSEAQFEEVVQLVIQLGNVIKIDTKVIQKMSYYLDKLQPNQIPKKDRHIQESNL